jgi:Ribonuclease G/E
MWFSKRRAERIEEDKLLMLQVALLEIGFKGAAQTPVERIARSLTMEDCILRKFVVMKE